jgi:hypothetical protein
MKNFLLTVTTIVILSLLAPIQGLAQFDDNLLGCYTDDDMSAVTMDVTPFVSMPVYIVLSDPYNYGTGTEVSLIGGIEFRFITSGVEHMLLDTVWSAPSYVDVGNDEDGHCVGFAAPLPVGDGGYLTMCVKTVVLMDEGVVNVHLSPTINPSIPGHMAYLDSSIDPVSIVRLYPASGDYADPVFTFYGMTVATDKASFDEIKAMYR